MSILDNKKILCLGPGIDNKKLYKIIKKIDNFDYILTCHFFDDKIKFLLDQGIDLGKKLIIIIGGQIEEEFSETNYNFLMKYKKQIFSILCSEVYTINCLKNVYKEVGFEDIFLDVLVNPLCRQYWDFEKEIYPTIFPKFLTYLLHKNINLKLLKIIGFTFKQTNIESIYSIDYLTSNYYYEKNKNNLKDLKEEYNIYTEELTLEEYQKIARNFIEVSGHSNKMDFNFFLLFIKNTNYVKLDNKLLDIIKNLP
jgi:hypothetical protein